MKSLKKAGLLILAIFLCLLCSCKAESQKSESPPEVKSLPDTCSPEVFSRIGQLDKSFRIPVRLSGAADTRCKNFSDWQSDTNGKLFAPLPDNLKLHWSYTATQSLCERLLLARGKTKSEEDLSGIIDAYLSKIISLPTLRYALKETNTTLSDLRDTWFGKNRAFEHVICGEPDPTNAENIGGFHFWYRFYMEERRKDGNAANWRCSLEGQGDPRIATIRFDWQTPGETKRRRKPIGGFTIGESVGALLAFGHIAQVYKCDIVPNGNDIVADINGKAYEWVVVMKDGNLLTFYPKAEDTALKKRLNIQ